MTMMEPNVFCAGAWTMPAEDDNQDYICPLRNNCYRYKGRNMVPVKATFDIPPFAINMQSCDHYINWR